MKLPEDGKVRRQYAGDHRGISPLKLLLKQVNNPLIYLLTGAAALSFATGHSIDAAVIGAVIILNTILGAVQELKADRALEALHRMAAPHAEVLRDGETVTVPSGEIVPGDVLLLRTGHRVPADARVFVSSELHVDESSLTGESEPLHKTPDSVDPDAQPADRRNMVWMSSAVTGGNGRAVVVATGMNTQLGRIAGTVRDTERGETPLQKRLSRLGLVLGLSGVGLSAVIFGLGLLQGHGLAEMALFAVAVAVSAIPEGLPAVISVTLALGVQRMARRNAVVRTLPAVETLGSTTVICSDKTGTITRNRMTVTHAWTFSNDIEVSSAGFSGVSEEGEMVWLLRTGALASNATVQKNGNTSGSPTEKAIVTAVEHRGEKVSDIRNEFPRKHEIPFSSEHKYMASLNGRGELVASVSGAADRVLGFCSRIMVKDEAVPLTDRHRERVEEAIGSLGEEGLRVLAGAYREIPGDTGSLERADVESDMVLAGLWGMVDPPRPEAVEAVAAAGRAGIRVVMITGDHAATARAIASSAGISSVSDRVITGGELDGMDDDELDSASPEVSVYARVSPSTSFKYCSP